MYSLFEIGHTYALYRIVRVHINTWWKKKHWMNEWMNEIILLLNNKKSNRNYARTHTHTHTYVDAHACALTSSVSFRNISNFFVCWCCFYCSQNRSGESHTAQTRETMDDTNQTICIDEDENYNKSERRRENGEEEKYVNKLRTWNKRRRRRRRNQEEP